MKPKWEREPCGCVKTDLPSTGRVMIRCPKHRGKPTKRLACYFDEHWIVQREARASAEVSSTNREKVTCDSHA